MCIFYYRNIYKVYISCIHVKYTLVYFSTSFSRESKDISFGMKLALKGLKIDKIKSIIEKILRDAMRIKLCFHL